MKRIKASSPISIATSWVSPDEPCFGLFELNMTRPPDVGLHRYRIIQVVRGDRLAEHVIDMGKASDFKCPEIRIPGGVADARTKRVKILHTVGQLLDIAQQWSYEMVTVPREIEAPDLVEGYWDTVEQKKDLFKHKGREIFSYG